MINDFLKFGYAAILTVIVIALAVDLVWGLAAGLAVALLGLLGLFLLHLRRFKRFVLWLEGTELEDWPKSEGVWESIYRKVYTARKKTEKNQAKLEEKELRFRSTLNDLPDGVVLMRKDFEIRWINRIAVRDLSLNKRQDIGRKLADVIHSEELMTHIRSEKWGESLMLSLPDGRTLEVRVISAGSKYTVVVTRDITESKRIDDFRRDFVANVSHELRTPLTVIKGFLELTEENSTLSQEDRLHLKMMSEQAERMSSLVDDLLTLSRLERDSAPAGRDPIDMLEVMTEAVAEGRMVSGGRHEIRIDKVACEWVLGDRKELRSAVTNLVTNAVRYTPEHGKVSLSWEVTDQGGVLSVSDNGIGIAPEDIPRVTERFYRVDKSRSRETGGTGLGLAIVKHVLFRHQAQLQIESEIGKGSTFKIVIPKVRLLDEEEELLGAPAEAAERSVISKSDLIH